MQYTQWIHVCFRVFCGTWNVNGQAATCEIHPWLSPASDEPPDIYAIGSVRQWYNMMWYTEFACIKNSLLTSSVLCVEPKNGQLSFVNFFSYRRAVISKCLYVGCWMKILQELYFCFCACFCSFQELDLSTNAYIFSGSVREEEWFSKVIDALHKKASYRKVWL